MYYTPNAFFASPGSVAFSIGPVDVHWYGIIIGFGILAAYWYAQSDARRRGLSVEPLADIAFWCVIAGVLGARAYYVLFTLDYFIAHPSQIPAIWNGGLAIHGGIIGGFIAAYIVAKKHKISLLQYADAAIPGVALAQAMGRWGNFFNSEAFGKPLDAWWSVRIPPSSRPQGFEAFETFHPTFLYESLWNLFVFCLLVAISRARPPRKKGSMVALYFVFYSIGRFFIEGIRLDSFFIGPFRTAQIVSVILIIGGLLYVFAGQRSSARREPR